MSGAGTFRLGALIATLLGVLLALGTWDGLYSRLDAPQALPALGPQLGGIATLMLAYLLWSAGANLALRRPVALAGAGFYLGCAAVIAGWLIFKHKIDLGIGDRGWIELIVTAVVFAILGLGLGREWRRA